MAVVNVLVPRRPEQVWDVLADGHAYADWVLGTKEIRDVDAGWPAMGTALHYTVGVGPVTLEGRTTVRRLEEGRRLGLEADAGLLGSARIVIDLDEWGEDTVVELDEHPLRGPAAWLHSPLSDVLVLLRGRPMLAQFSRVVEERHPR
ncbi:SRPBCC family protein [Geodermatophilus sp. SYSU D00815]